MKRTKVVSFASIKNRCAGSLRLEFYLFRCRENENTQIFLRKQDFEKKAMHLSVLIKEHFITDEKRTESKKKKQCIDFF